MYKVVFYKPFRYDITRSYSEQIKITDKYFGRQFEIISWLEERFGKPGGSFFGLFYRWYSDNFHDRVEYCFRRKEDAILFKLTWGGYV